MKQDKLLLKIKLPLFLPTKEINLSKRMKTNIRTLLTTCLKLIYSQARFYTLQGPDLRSNFNHETISEIEKNYATLFVNNITSTEIII